MSRDRAELCRETRHCRGHHLRKRPCPRFHDRGGFWPNSDAIGTEWPAVPETVSAEKERLALLPARQKVLPYLGQSGHLPYAYKCLSVSASA